MVEHGERGAWSDFHVQLGVLHVQITEFTPNSPWFTHIGAAAVTRLTLHQIKLYSNFNHFT